MLKKGMRVHSSWGQLLNQGQPSASEAPGEDVQNMTIEERCADDMDGMD